MEAPLADLFPHCTVLFADISGFTAWSSTRDPAQVFILLQTVYQAFDKISKRRKVCPPLCQKRNLRENFCLLTLWESCLWLCQKVFKVETVRPLPPVVH